MRLLFASDIHLGESRRLQDTQKILYFILNSAVSSGVDKIVLLGDIFDKRKPTPKEMRVFNLWVKEVLKTGRMDILVLKGNHDTDRGISTLSYLEDLSIPGVEVVNPPYIFDTGNGKFYLGHEQVYEAIADNGIKLLGGRKLDDIIKEYPDCDVYAFGDFHKPQILREEPLSFYAGSINNFTFAEKDDVKKVYIFEDTKLTEVINLPTRKMFEYNMEVFETHDYNPRWGYDDLEGAMVKLVFVGSKTALRGVKTNEIVSRLKNDNKVFSVKVEYKVTDKVQPRNELINESVSEEQALEEYFKAKDLDKELKTKIVEIGTEIIKDYKNG